MKKIQIIMGAALLFSLVAAPAAFAKKNKGGGAAAQTAPSDVFAKYDVNSNGTLDTSEIATLRADFEKNPDDTLLKTYDTDGDKKLSDGEIAAIPATKTVDAPAKGKKHKK